MSDGSKNFFLRGRLHDPKFITKLVQIQNYVVIRGNQKKKNKKKKEGEE
jgi:hypothetical protein